MGGGREEGRRATVCLCLTSVRCQKNRGRVVFNSYEAQPVFNCHRINYRDGPNGLSSLPCH